MLRPVCCSLAVLACGAFAAQADGLPTARDLLPLLRQADVCSRSACTPARLAAPNAATDGPVMLRPDAGRDAYLRVAVTPELELDVESTGATLQVDVEADGVGVQRVHDATVTGRHPVRVGLDRFAAHVVRLALRVASVEPTARVALHAATLRDAMPAEPPVLARPPARARPPNVVVYVIDTLRADHVGCYGYGRPTTPRIDAFARTAVRFRRAVAQSSWTLPSVASLLTGLEPRRHGAVEPDRGLRPEVATLAQLLAARGWTTAGFVTNYLGSDVFGLGRGFHTFHFYREQGAARRAVYLRSDSLLRRIERWLAHPVTRPFLLYVHVTDPHFPYVPPARYARRFLAAPMSPAEIEALTDRVRALHNGQDDWGTRPAPISAADLARLRDLYDGEVRFADEYFGRLLDALQHHGLLDDTVVLLTSDHGEEFLEHGGVGHGQTLHGEVLDVPLLLRLPGAVEVGTHVDRVVRQVDVLPTILDAAGVPAPPGLDGRSWLAAASSPPAAAEAPSMLRLGPFDQQALIADPWKAIRDFTAPLRRRLTLFDTRSDPGELHDVSGTASPLLLGYVRARLRELAGPVRPGPRVPDDRLDRLRALGYLAE